MSKIQILDEHIANQIAAGEVVERPSSAVKELVENSIDAGSTKIDVYIEEGGLQLIRICDNGSGIEADDCETAFFRHATSKISTSKDLFRIRSLGFRGEALPSIAAVSKVECVTATEPNGLGRKIVIEGGIVKSIGDCTASKGTDIQVKDLFYNTPARLKYMKTIQTELSHVSDYMYRLAMAHPSIAFSLRHNGNVLMQTLGNGDLLQVVAAIYGTGIAKSMLPIHGTGLDYSIKGFVSKPEMTRANRAAISTIINGRYIRNHALVHALLNAYHTLLPINRYPIAVLQIEMDPTLVDVNVHPSKLEVRFSKEAELVEFVQTELKRVLQQQVHIPAAAKSVTKKTPVIQEQLEWYRNEQPVGKSEASVLMTNTVSNEPNIVSAMSETAAAVPSNKDVFGPEPDNADRRDFSRFNQQKLHKNEARTGAYQEKQHAKFVQHMIEGGKGTDFKEHQPSVPAFPKLHPIGQMHGTYIIAQNEDGLFLIDQHAAHERINYERYFEWFGNPVQASQELLVPITLEFTPSEAELLSGKLILFEQVGVYLEYFGGNSFLVRSYPHWIPAGDEKAVIEEMAEWILSEKKQIDIAKIREKAAILCSCKASIKANQNLSIVEMEALLDRLGNCGNPYTCPHGRPIVVSFSTYELEKMFKRVSSNS